MRRLSFIGVDRFGALLVLLLGMFVLGPLLQETRFGTALLAALVALVLADALVASGVTGRRMRFWAVVSGILAVTVSVGVMAVEGDPPAWTSALLAVVLFATTGLVLHRILGQDRVTLSTVSGALCAYIMIGLAFASVYRTISTLDAAAFSTSIDANASYYSFVTLTTLGYGDITPVSSMARSLSTLEAVLGQVMLVVLVARFVGNLGQPRLRPERPGAAPDDGGATESTAPD